MESQPIFGMFGSIFVEQSPDFGVGGEETAKQSPDFRWVERKPNTSSSFFLGGISGRFLRTPRVVVREAPRAGPALRGALGLA